MWLAFVQLVLALIVGWLGFVLVSLVAAAAPAHAPSARPRRPQSLLAGEARAPGAGYSPELMHPMSGGHGNAPVPQDAAGRG